MSAYKELAEKLDKIDNVSILTHKSPDGDCIGGGLALCYWLRSKGKKANVLNSDGIPERYDFLSQGYEPMEFEEQAVVSVDVADTALLGDVLSHYADRIDICIDHHKSNKSFAKYSYVDKEASAVCLVLYELFEYMGGGYDKLRASCLYTGIATDTGCFKYQNTTPAAHRAAAGLMEKDVDYENINRRMFDIKSRGRILAEQRLIGRMKYFADDAIAIITITNEMIENYGIDRSELDGFASIPLTVEGVKIGITLKQQPDDENVFKASIRTTEADASALASEFGGGGHIRAAGCTLNGGARDVTKRIVAAAKRYL